MADRVESGLGALASLAHRRPGWSLLAVALVTGLAMLSARTLEVDPDIANMLPQSFESVENLERLKRRFGGIGYVTVHVSGAPPDALRRFARLVAPKIAALPEVRYVDFERPTKFFKDRSLYYVNLPDIKEIHKRVKARAKYEKLKANPLYVDIEDTKPPSIDFGDIIERNKKQKREGYQRVQLDERFYIKPKRRELVLLVKPTGLSTDMDFTKRVVRRVREVLAAQDKKSFGDGLKVQLCGRYTKRVDQQLAVGKDLRTTSVVALVLMLLYLGVHFRRILAVILVFVPLAAGIVWTFGFAGLIVPSLNMLSAFFGVILLGLGIDHGIHLLSRYYAETQEHREPAGAIRAAFGHTGRAVTIAALTTTVAFIGLSITEFRGFREFGRIAAAGTVLVVLAYLVCLPALLAFAHRLGWRPPAQKARDQSGEWARRALRAAPVALILAGAALAFTLFQARRAQFEFDFSKLARSDLPSVAVDRRVDGIIGRSQAAFVFLTDSTAQARAVAQELRRRRDAHAGKSPIDFVITPTDFVPAAQEAKRKLLLEVIAELDDVDTKDFKGKDRERLEEIRRFPRFKPFTSKDLPIELRRQFNGIRQDQPGSFALAFSAVPLHDGLGLRKLARQLRHVKLPGGGVVSAAGEGMVLADVLDTVIREAPKIMGIAAVLVFLTIWLLCGSLPRALLCLVPAVITLAATAGLMPLFGLKFNYLNVVMMPVLFGLAVDGGVHIVLRQAADGDLALTVNETGRAITGAIITTMLGFGALLLAKHPGLQSLAQLTLVGLACNLVATLVVLPALLALPRSARAAWERKDHRTDP